MLLALATIVAKPGKRDEIVRLAGPCLEASRQEPGVLSYQLYVSAEDSVTVRFIEKYVDKAALKAHAKSAHLQALGKAIADFQEGEMQIELYPAPDPVQPGK